MDIVLERILSLIPKKPNGEYVHGAKKAFATRIGYGDGQIISMWESGASMSYMGKLHEIAMKYGVSVEWLMGEKMRTIGERIKARREDLHMSQEELAKKLGYKSRSSINKIELDLRSLTQSKIKAMADALETTPSYIMGWEKELPAKISENKATELQQKAINLVMKLDEKQLRQFIRMIQAGFDL